MKIYNFPQYSPEWWAIRAKRLTASHATAIGNCGAGLKTYVREKMRELYSKAERINYTNKHLERGIELEPSAGMAYSFNRDIVVKKVGFVVYNEYVGCSPDLFAGTNGLAEIKCPDDKEYFNLLLGDKPESKNIWQCQCQMLICEKKWCDLVCYNPNFEKELIIERLYPDEKKFSDLKKGFALGEKMIKEIEQEMN